MQHEKDKCIRIGFTMGLCVFKLRQIVAVDLIFIKLRCVQPSSVVGVIMRLSRGIFYSLPLECVLSSE